MNPTPEPVPDRFALADALREAFPAYRAMVDEIESETTAIGGFSEYSLLSVVFRWEVLESAVATGDREALRAAFEFIERLVTSPDRNVQDPTDIRVVSYLLQNERWTRTTRQYAGPALTKWLAHELELPPPDGGGG